MNYLRQSIRQSIKRITVSGMGIMLAVLTAFMTYTSAYATQMGTIPELAAHVYENTDENSNIVANVIMGQNFPILGEETDEAGNVWYLIEADTGARGYIPAGSVIRVTSGAQAENNTQSNNPQTIEPAEENEDENNLPGTMRSQILATEVVNIRENPSTTDDIVGKIPRGTTLDYIDVVTNESGEEWYEVSYEDVHGYVKQSTVRMIETPEQEAGIQPDITDMTMENIDIDQIIETARLYQDENPPKETMAKADSLSESQEQELIEYENNDMPYEDSEIAVKKGLELHVDMVIIFSALGILVCTVIVSRTFGRMVKMYR